MEDIINNFVNFMVFSTFFLYLNIKNINVLHFIINKMLDQANYFFNQLEKI